MFCQEIEWKECVFVLLCGLILNVGNIAEMHKMMYCVLFCHQLFLCLLRTAFRIPVPWCWSWFHFNITLTTRTLTSLIITFILQLRVKNKLFGFSPQANYTNWATSARWWRYGQLRVSKHEVIFGNLFVTERRPRLFTQLTTWCYLHGTTRAPL